MKYYTHQEVQDFKIDKLIENELFVNISHLLRRVLWKHR